MGRRQPQLEEQGWFGLLEPQHQLGGAGGKSKVLRPTWSYPMGKLGSLKP